MAATAVPLRARPVLGALLRSYEEQLTSRGRYLLWVTAAFALLGLDTRRSRIFVLFAIAAGAIVLAWLFTRFRRPRARLLCALPRRATARVPLAIKARLVGENGPLRGLRVQFPRPIRWGGSIRVTPAEFFVDADEPGAQERSVELLALRRGRYELRGPTLRVTDPLRLTAGRGRSLPDQALLVYPRFYRMADFSAPVGRRYQPGGIPLSSSTGDAIEFVGTRDYREGDPLKHIHWRSWARRGAPVVKEYQEEYFCRIALILDTYLPRRPTARQHAAFEAAVSVLASIADYFTRSEYVIDILAAGREVYDVSAGRSLAYLENVLDVLACLEPCHEPPFAGIGPHLFEKLRQTTTVVAVLQDWDRTRQEFLGRVKAHGTAVRVVVVREGAASPPWQAAAADLGEITTISPTQVEAALSGEEPRV